MGSCVRRNDAECVVAAEPHAECVGAPQRTNYASPAVSNIAALIASGAVLPAQTTNWNAG